MHKHAGCAWVSVQMPYKHKVVGSNLLGTTLELAGCALEAGCEKRAYSLEAHMVSAYGFA